MKLRNVRVALLLALSVFASAGCRQQKDPEIAQLRDEVGRLSKENQQFKEQVDSLSSRIKEQQTQISELLVAKQPKPAVTAAPDEPKPQGMSVDRARAELTPLLSAMIKELKDERDTATATGGFGMRTEYYLRSAVYGLIRSTDPGTSYLVKVLVPSEKFVVSQTGSKSYGKDTERFLFAYRKQKWVLLSNN
jgi:hypothetical protein